MRQLGQLAVIAIVVAAVTLVVNLAIGPWLAPLLPVIARVVAPVSTAPAPPDAGAQLPAALRMATAPLQYVVTLPTPDPHAPTAVVLPAARVAQAGAVAGGTTPTPIPATLGVIPCQDYPLDEVLAAFRRANLPLRDSLFDPAYPGTDQPFPITARVRDYARSASGLPNLRLDIFILPDAEQVSALQGDAGRWALQQHRQVRLFPYRNVALVFYEADPARAVAYEQALVRLP